MTTPSIELLEDKVHPDDWRVEQIHQDGTVDVAIFSGANAEVRATEYHRYMSRET